MTLMDFAISRFFHIPRHFHIKSFFEKLHNPSSNMMNLRKLLVMLISCVFGEDSLPQLIINEANGYVIRQIKLATIQDHPLKIPYTVSLTKNIPTGVNVHAECNAKNMARGF